MDQNFNLSIEDYYRKYYQKLYFHACSILGRNPEAEAAVQEAFLAACRKPSDFMESESQLGWLKKAVEHEALHISRKQKYTAALFLSLEDLSPGHEPAISESPDSDLIEFCQSVVSKESFDFFLRIARQDSTFLEEAEKQGIKLFACYKRFERIRRKLQQALEKYYKE